jgi:hypothetical protein
LQAGVAVVAKLAILVAVAAQAVYYLYQAH